MLAVTTVCCVPDPAPLTASPVHPPEPLQLQDQKAPPVLGVDSWVHSPQLKKLGNMPDTRFLI